MLSMQSFRKARLFHEGIRIENFTVLSILFSIFWVQSYEINFIFITFASNKIWLFTKYDPYS